MNAISDYLALDSLLFRLLALLAALVIHDIVLAALLRRFGDSSAADQGRLSLNPTKHMEGIGLSIILFGPYGWSKPLPKDVDKILYGKRGFAAILACGPLLHLGIGLVCWWMYLQMPGNALVDQNISRMYELLKGVVYWSYVVNMMLFIVRLLPLYPTNAYQALCLYWPRLTSARVQWMTLAVLVGLLVTPIGRWLLDFIFLWLNQILAGALFS